MDQDLLDNGRQGLKLAARKSPAAQTRRPLRRSDAQAAQTLRRSDAQTLRRAGHLQIKPIADLVIIHNLPHSARAVSCRALTSELPTCGGQDKKDGHGAAAADDDDDEMLMMILMLGQDDHDQEG